MNKDNRQYAVEILGARSVSTDYASEVRKLRDLIKLILTFGDGAGDLRTFRRARELGFSTDQVEKVNVFINSLIISDGNVELAAIRTGNVNELTKMPNDFARVVANIMRQEKFIVLKEIDERLVVETPYAIAELVLRLYKNQDQVLLSKLVANDGHFEPDLIAKIADLVNYYVNDLPKDSLDNLEPVVALSNRIHPKPLSIASIKVIVLQCVIIDGADY